MFCYQCEQTSQGCGCTTMGICGKTPDVATLQDLMVYIAKGIAQYAHAARQLGTVSKKVDAHLLEAMFMTLTNVNFDLEEHYRYIQTMTGMLREAHNVYTIACKQAGKTAQTFRGPAQFVMPADLKSTLQFAESLSISKRMLGNEDMVGLQELVTYGVKGLAAYAHHALLLGYADDTIFAFVEDALNYLTTPDQTMDKLLEYALKAGEVNLRVMELLDQAHTETFGHPEPTLVRITPIVGKCILVSGHDMNSLNALLKATEGKGINVYTHGELLTAHSYPEMKKYSHLVGNYGGAWQNQVTEFAEFPGAILVTTNCLKPPADSYKDRIYTMDVVGYEGVRKIADNNFAPLIEAALKQPGFTKDTEVKTITIGFGRNAVLSVADKVVSAVKDGKIKHFFLIGGCDGAEYTRNYFSDLADEIPEDCVILTLGCGKYRFNKEEFGDIGGIPRLLDIGQCNDTYSAIKIAAALADAFNCTVNELPLSLMISWFEQKAVAVLLTLLYLGIRDIRLGPALPAFVTPNVLNKLVEAYGVKPIGKPEKDLEACLAK